MKVDKNLIKIYLLFSNSNDYYINLHLFLNFNLISNKLQFNVAVRLIMHAKGKVNVKNKSKNINFSKLKEF